MHGKNDHIKVSAGNIFYCSTCRTEISCGPQVLVSEADYMLKKFTSTHRFCGHKKLKHVITATILIFSFLKNFRKNKSGL